MATPNNSTLKVQEGVKEDQLRELAKNIVTNLSEKDLLKKEEPTDVVCKMLIKGKASKLCSLISNLLGVYYSSGTSYSKGFDTDLKITLMVEKVKDSQKE